MMEAGQAYAGYYHTTDTYVGPRRRSLGIDVYSFDMLISRQERNRSEFWNDWILRYKVCSPAGVSKDVLGIPVPATLMAYKDSPARVFNEREVSILSLLKPSFDAAVKAVQRFKRAGSDLLSFVDDLAIPVLVITERAIAHANRSFLERMGQNAHTAIDAVALQARRLLRDDVCEPPLRVSGEVALTAGRPVSWSAYLLWGGTGVRTQWCSSTRRRSYRSPKPRANDLD